MLELTFSVVITNIHAINPQPFIDNYNGNISTAMAVMNLYL
jgi:hypothetical protein